MPVPVEGEAKPGAVPLHSGFRQRSPRPNVIDAMTTRTLHRSTPLRCFAAIVASLVGASAALGQVTVPSTSAPPMERVPAGDEWELDFVPKALRVHVDEATGRSYWVLSYEVGNRTDRARTWAPVFELQGTGGPIQRSGREVPSVVTDDVKRILNRSEVAQRPPVLDQNQAIGLLPVGRAHVRDGFAIWPATVEGVVPGHDVGPTTVVVYVGGVSNRRGMVSHPITGEDVVLRQQQAITFQTPGRIGALHGKALKPTSETWIYR